MPGTLFVYGDSYSDVKNRKSNGPLWSEKLADRWHMQLQSYAKQGAVACKPTQKEMAGTSYLAQQVAEAAKHVTNTSEDNVHAIFIGLSDVTNSGQHRSGESE
ncbi:hypothetical protein BCR43DRAFT_134943 [Syncephalastrum racemosum]|uniref:SGNH hydrolase-type esterase domain-containing protein n=1 Tax=Syncephalastrum racemosum TaxID=13706 RepID=A0A1X2HLN9_SYNRA|nr:hypothetical protein BCR43DRAFT_134943 [Syncephalastrum racemosum]